MTAAEEKEMRETVRDTHTGVTRIEEEMKGIKKDVRTHEDTLYLPEVGLVYKVHDAERTTKALIKVAWILVTAVIGAIVISLLR